MPDPDYHRMGDHTETVRVEYDPAVISYDQLLEVFWSLQDPTAEPYLRQYRNVIFVLDAHQLQLAEWSKSALADKTGQTINTAIEAAGIFTEAEDYHQKYYLRRADQLVQVLRPLYVDEASLIASTVAARINGYLGCHGDPQTLAADIAGLGLPEKTQQEFLEYLVLTCREFKGVGCSLSAMPAR
jgi:peptide-methionine (S)-S-oxide reductase